MSLPLGIHESTATGQWPVVVQPAQTGQLQEGVSHEQLRLELPPVEQFLEQVGRGAAEREVPQEPDQWPRSSRRAAKSCCHLWALIRPKIWFR